MDGMRPAYLGSPDARPWMTDAGGALGRVQLAIRGFVRGYPQLSEPGTLAVVALSGGGDSLAVAAALAWVAPPLGLQTAAVTVDHGWREGSAAEAQAAAAVALTLGLGQSRAVPLGAAPAGQGPEGAAREARWEVLGETAAQLARERGCTRAVILTGHTADDQAETVLLGLARGASTSSRAGMMPLTQLRADPDVWAGKPLLGLRREDTLAACAQAQLDPVRDPTNYPEGPVRTATGAPLPRAALRHQVIPALNAALGQDVVDNLARSAQIAREDVAALDFYATAALEEAWPGREAWRPGHPIMVAAPALARLPRSVRLRVYRRLGEHCGWRGAEITSAHLDAIDALIADWHGQGAVDLPGARAQRVDGYLRLEA